MRVPNTRYQSARPTIISAPVVSTGRAPPSIVYGEGSYGGTSVLRGLAGLPFCIPVIGDGGQRVQPIHVATLPRRSGAVCMAPARRTIDAVRAEAMTLATSAPHPALARPAGGAGLPVPTPLIRAAAWLGDVAGPARSAHLAAAIAIW